MIRVGPNARRQSKQTVLRVLKLLLVFGVSWQTWSLFWLTQHAQLSNNRQIEALSQRADRSLSPPKMEYVIPLELVVKDPVPVAQRDYSKEVVRTKAGRRSYISTEAFREYGEEVRYLIQQGRDNFRYGATNTTLAFRHRLHARAPWLRGDPNHPGWPHDTLPKRVPGRALVICAGDRQLHYLKNLVHSVRVDHGSAMPIRIVFLDNDDLTPAARLQVEQVIPGTNKNIQFINLSDYFDLKAVHLKGWDLKAYGLLAVSEQEVMFVDVDVVLLQPPENMFSPRGYQDVGALFYHDRMMLDYINFLYDPGTFANAMQPTLSPTALRLIHNGNTPYNAEHIQESGMLLFDKGRRILGLWATCLVYGREDIRKYAQRYHMYGDKEMYWISFETIGEPYEFSRYYPGTIGSVASDFGSHNIASLPTDTEADRSSKLEDANANHMGLCGRLTHFDDNGVPLWSNGGYLTKEEDWPNSNVLGVYPLNPIWYVDGGDWLSESLLPPITQGWLTQLLSWVLPSLFSPIAETRAEWQRVKAKIPVNSYWQVQENIGVNCIMANGRGIRPLPDSAHVIAMKSVHQYFNVELGMHLKYEQYF